MSRPFRFGVVAAQAGSSDDWRARARRIEALGYATLGMPDGLRYTLAPFPALAAAAMATETLRLTTYVLANDFRSPVLVAKDAATIDVLSGGRFELGLGVGRPQAAADNRMLGIPFDSGAVRVERLAESLTVVKALLTGEKTGPTGQHYAVNAAEISPLPSQKPRPPILVAAARRRLLQLAAREADIVALGAGPTDGEEKVGEMIGWIREAAGSRFGQLELNINLMAVGHKVPRYITSQMGLTADALGRMGAVSALVGTEDEMCETLLRRRDRLGISYVMVSDELMDALAPVVERLRDR